MKTDPETLVQREHAAARIAAQLELPDSGWPGEGAAAEVARVHAALRIDYVRWLAEVGEITDGD